MNFKQSPKRLAAVFAILLLIAISVSIALTQSGGTKNVAVNGSLPTVSTQAGVAPTIGKPSGSAPTSLITKDIIVGTGKAAVTGSTVTAHYVLMSWKTGNVLQSSWTSGQAPTFSLFGVIPGWQQGIPGMKVGGRRLLVIPPPLAYGANGSGPVGPNETLVFVVDLVAVN